MRKVGHQELLKTVFNSRANRTKKPNTSKKRGTETEEHLKLKGRAVMLLEQMGCHNIAQEKTLLFDEAERRSYTDKLGIKRYKLGTKRLRLDVVGLLGEQLIAIECGGCSILRSETRKILEQMLNTGKLTKLYILPYGENELYEWSDRLDICPYCGHVTNRNAVKNREKL